MSLTAGTRLGLYEIVGAIGAGGMGEVYRARDTKLGREVALKVLPELFAGDPERVQRFEREAQVLASLNHPNIAQIYGLEDGPPDASPRVRALVMELVEGPTLAEALGTGPSPAHGLPMAEALAIARQIAGALEAAHGQGIIHRDLKPANIKLKGSASDVAGATVKVLDFGLAKLALATGSGPQTSQDPAHSPTITSPATRLGVILGTAAYMAPEQAKGKPVDARADIWAFGAVLYETLTGRRAFPGEDLTDTFAAIARDEPDWKSLPADTPRSVSRLLRRCLAKDPRHRLQHIGDARLELDDAIAGGADEPGRAGGPPTSPAPRWRRLAPWAAAIVAVGVAGWALGSRDDTAAPRPVQRYVLAPPAEGQIITASAPAILLSPDGTSVVSSVGTSRRWQLFARPLSDTSPQPIDGTAGASHQAFSPDGRWLAFFAGGQLKRVSLSGGAPETICPAPNPRGAAWAPDDTIIFTPGTDAPLSRVAAGGGPVDTISTLDVAARERSHRWPDVLPGGRAALITIAYEVGNPLDDASVGVLDLTTGRHQTILKGGGFARYVPTGHIVYARRGDLVAVPFDLTRLEVTGPPVVVEEGVGMSVTSGAAQFSFSRAGDLAFVAAGPRDPASARAPLVWVDRRGEEEVAVEEPRRYSHPRLTSDGQSLILEVDDPDSAIWSYSFARKTLSRITTAGVSYGPMPTPDGTRLAFESVRDGVAGVFLARIDGSGEERLTSTTGGHSPTSWTPDGKTLAMSVLTDSGVTEIWIVEIDGDRTPRPVIQGPYNASGGAFSPDGRWLAYVSDETGRDEVYVRPFPGSGAGVQISGEGGSEPVWARDGRELFFRNDDELLAAAVTPGPTFSAGRPRVLFSRPNPPGQSGGIYESEPDYAVSADGQRFLMPRYRADASAAPSAHLVLNWFEALKTKTGEAR